MTKSPTTSSKRCGADPAGVAVVNQPRSTRVIIWPALTETQKTRLTFARSNLNSRHLWAHRTTRARRRCCERASCHANRRGAAIAAPADRSAWRNRTDLSERPGAGPCRMFFRFYGRRAVELLAERSTATLTPLTALAGAHAQRAPLSFHDQPGRTRAARMAHGTHLAEDANVSPCSQRRHLLHDSRRRT